MKATRKIFVILWAIIALNVNKSEAQVDLKASYIFTGDSVSGFDEPSVSAAALSNGCYGKEFKVFVYNQKRIFIKQKYKLKTTSLKNLTLFQNLNSFKTSSLPAGGACNNEDFELAAAQINAPGAVQGWSLQSGSYNGGCNPPGFFATNNYTVFNAATIDPKIPGQVSSYFDAQVNTAPAGNCFLKLNDATAGAKSAQASKAFIVNPNNALFQYAYLPVIQDGTHACCDQPGFSIKVTVTNTVTSTSTVLACPNISIAVPGAGCSFTVPPGGPVFVPAVGGGNWVYSNWTASAIDLSPYLNNLVQIDVTVVDCGFGGHGAYIYFDAKCAPMTIIGNGNQFPAGTPSITLPTCGATGATIIAPAGLGPYSWAGAVGPPYTTPLMSNQTLTTTNSGNFTLTMNPPGSCAPIIRIITVTITPAPQIFASVAQAPCGSTVAVASCTTAGSASVASTIVWTPNPLSLNASTTQATYLVGTGPVTVTASDPLGCMASATVNINSAPPAPTFTITNVTGSGSITCAHPTINFTAASSYTYGTLTYTWVSLSGTASGTNVTLSNPTPYTVTATDQATGCSSFSVFTIGINTVAPTSTVTPMVQNIICPAGSPATFTAITTNTSTNMMQCWTSPFSPAPVCSNGTLSIFPAPIGISTVCITNNINGCSVCKTVTVTSSSGFPTFNVTSPQQFTIGCGTTSLATISISSVTTNPIPGGSVNYTLLPPSFVGPSYSFSNVSTFTVNTPGQYTVITHDISNNCETRVPVSIIQNTVGPQITAAASQETLTCKVPKTILQGTSTNTNVSFSWAFPGAPGQTPNDTLTVFTTTNTTNTVVATYTLSITDNINKCKSTQTLTIYQNIAKPTASITGGNQITCATPTINLTNSSYTNAVTAAFDHHLVVIGYIWSGPSPQPTYSNTSTYIAFTPAGVANAYTLVAMDMNNGCTAVATKTIADNRIYPVVNNPVAPAPFVLDCGTPGSNCTMIAPIISGTTTGFTYAWGVVPTTSFSCLSCSTTCVNKTGEYNIFVTNPANGCVTEAQVQVIDGTLNGDFAPSSITGFAPLTVTFQNLSASSSPSTPNASITSVWSFGNGGSQVTNSVSISPVTTYSNPGTYTVTMYALKGSCKDTVVKIITVEIPSKFEVPNVFTPNGDGSNDIFFLKVTNLTDINALIFDRWGNKVFESNSNTGNIAWDGKNMSGKETAVGTYFYIIKGTGKDGKEYDQKGNVSLYR
ncbi:MAG: gliding motility-associated C-terminal domain-containing protein [Bacteroidetes bacterium]|nr:gliding motility-associated C-terminal domain-containing protein [Bacteroidota bacterium]